MIIMIYRILSLILSFLMTALSPLGISFEGLEEKLQPSASIVGEFSYGDENPEISIEVGKTSFRLKVADDSVVLDGAFRGLEIDSVKRMSPRSLLICTKGKISSELSEGYVLLDENATYSKTFLQAKTEIDMSKIDPGIVGGLDGEDIAKKAAKSLITMGIKKIPYVGGFAATALDSTINSILGIKEAPSISDVINELHAISAQLDELTKLVSASSQEILKSLYEEKNFITFNSEVNSLKNSVNAMLNQLAVIEGSSGSESYKFLMTAELLDFDEKNISSMVKQTRDLANYLDGTQISARPQKGIFEKAYDYVCTDAILGGEAASIVAPYVNEISGVFSYSYKVMAIVLNAKLWVHDNYDKIITDAETDPDLKKELDTLENGNYDSAYYFGLWTDLLSESSETSIAKIHNKHFSDEDPESTAEKYNALIKANWFSYIRSVTVTSDDIVLDLVPFYSSIGVVTPTELGINTSKKESSTDGMVSTANSELRSRMYSSGVNNEDIKRIINHIYENKNGVFYDASEAKTSFTENTILGMLEEYGFSVPSSGGTKLFISDSSKKYTHDKYTNPYSAWDKYIANAKAYGTDCGKAIGFNNGFPAESINWDTVTYYDYWYNLRNPSAKETKNYVGNYSFYYFRAAPLEINSETDFRNFISDIASGNTYYQRQVVLNSDLDLSGIQYNKIWAAGNSREFRGTFDGNLHIISGLNDTVTGGSTGLFRTLGDSARIQNLVLENVNINGSSNTGALAGNVSGNAVVSGVNVNKSSKVSGTAYVGGLIGRISSGSVVIKDCDNYAEVTASDSYAGGIVGGSPNKYSQNITLCTNHGTVYVTKRAASTAAGIIAYMADDSADQAHTVTYCRNFGSVTNDGGYAGGIIGHLDSDSTRHIVTNNRNDGEIGCANGIAGGIVAYSEGGGTFTENINTMLVAGKVAGGIMGQNEDDSINFSNCHNIRGDIRAVSYAGGILAYTGSRDLDKVFIFDNCSNSGYVYSDTSYAGGIAGVISSDNLNHSFMYCTNENSIKGYFSTGGIVGKLEGGGKFKCQNNGIIVSESTCAGGIVGYVVDDGCTFTGCWNMMSVSGVESCGGIVGEAGDKDGDKTFTFTDCVNFGTVISSGLNAGGIIGMLKTDSTEHLFDGNKNYALVEGKSTAGGIIGFMYGGGEIKNNVNGKAIVCKGDYAGGIIGRIEDDKCTFTDNTNSGGVSSSKYQGQTCGYDGYSKKTI